MVRIGVIADTHCPEILDELPPRALELLSGVDLIVHAGDITAEETLSQLQRIAPVEAIRGDHDRKLKGLPKTKVLEIEGKRIGLIHGSRSHLIEEPLTLLGTLSLGYLWLPPKLDEWLLGWFPDVDVIVYGHTHRPRIKWHGRTLIFNPGGVFQITQASCRMRLERRPGWFTWCWLQVARHIRRVGHPPVGVLEVNQDSVSASILAL